MQESKSILGFDKLVIYDNPVNSGSTNDKRASGESSKPINMTCYLCNESLGSSLCNYCKSQFPFQDLDGNAFKIVLYEFQHGTISFDTDQLETPFFNPILDQHSSLSDPNSDLYPYLNN